MQKARVFAYMRNQWSVTSPDGAVSRYTVNTLLTSLIGLKERCVFCGEKPNKYLRQDIPQSMRPLNVHYVKSNLATFVVLTLPTL